MSKVLTREEWLNKAAQLLRPIFKTRAAVTLPDNIRLSCGWTSSGTRGKSIGECWASTASRDGTFEMFISPRLAEPVRVLDVLVHELTHAGVGLKNKHNKTFGKAARAMLLEGKLTATTGGDAFKAEIAAPLLAQLPTYPHAEMRPGGLSDAPKKQSTRLIKACCPECGYTVRVTRSWLDVGAPVCPIDEIAMEEGE